MTPTASPLDIVEDVAVKRGFSVDTEGFAGRMREQRERARAARRDRGGSDILTRFQALQDEGVQSEFFGYDALCGKSRVVALLDEDALPVDALPSGSRGYVVTGARRSTARPVARPAIPDCWSFPAAGPRLWIPSGRCRRLSRIMWK